jgi:ribosomal protein S14
MYNFKDTLNIVDKKDLKFRIIYHRNELKIKFLKTLIKDIRITYKYRFMLKIKFLQLYGRYTLVHRNRCILTGRTRFIFTFFNLSRASLKFYMSFGHIVGFRRW